MKSSEWTTKPYDNRRAFIGGSHARIIMGEDEGALLRLGEKSAAKPSLRTCLVILIIQLGTAAEELNRALFERNNGLHVTAIQRASSTLQSPGWSARWTASSKRAERCSKPNSCYPHGVPRREGSVAIA
jgi:hypothetical protein